VARSIAERETVVTQTIKERRDRIRRSGMAGTARTLPIVNETKYSGSLVKRN